MITQASGIRKAGKPLSSGIGADEHLEGMLPSQKLDSHHFALDTCGGALTVLKIDPHNRVGGNPIANFQISPAGFDLELDLPGRCGTPGSRHGPSCISRKEIPPRWP